MRFTEEEKLTIIAEGEKIGVKTVCAKYDISDQTYRDWRYKALEIKPRKHLSSAKRLQVLREGERNLFSRMRQQFPQSSPNASVAYRSGQVVALN